MIERSEPIFAVRDVPEAIAFYRDVLGGGGDWTWGEPVEFGGVRLGKTQVLFNRQPELAGRVAGHEHFFAAEDVQALHDRHAAAGAPIVVPIENKPWGLREYTVRDPNGYRLRFTGPAGYEKPADATDTLPDRVRVEERLVTFDEYRDLKRSVGWDTDHDTPDMLRHNVAGAVAIDTEAGDAVGMARAVRDAPRWYSLWDVVVRPAWQSRRVGTALTESLLAQLRRSAPPGANVFLFTHQDRFYERLGFASRRCTMLTL